MFGILKIYDVEVSYKDLRNIIHVKASSRRKAKKTAKQFWEPYLWKYDTDWPEAKKDFKYKIVGKRKVK